MKYGARASRPHHKQIERALCALPCVDKTTLTNNSMNVQMLNNAIARVFITITIALLICGSGNIMRAQRDTDKSGKSADNAKGSILGRSFTRVGASTTATFQTTINIPNSGANVELYDPIMRKVIMTTKTTGGSPNLILREAIMPDSGNQDKRGWFSFDGVTPGNYIIDIGDNDRTSNIRSLPPPHPVAISVKAGLNKLKSQYIAATSVYSSSDMIPIISEESKKMDAILDKYPVVSGMGTIVFTGSIAKRNSAGNWETITGRIGDEGKDYRLFTVCDVLKFKPFHWLHSVRAVIIGNLVQTPEGSWLEGSCGNPIKSGSHTWQDAISVNFNDAELNAHKQHIDVFDSWLNEEGDHFVKDFIKNYGNGNNGVPVAVVGDLVVPDNLVYTKCGEKKTCGFGYGPIAAPLRIDSWHMRYLNQQATSANPVYDALPK